MPLMHGSERRQLECVLLVTGPQAMDCKSCALQTGVPARTVRRWRQHYCIFGELPCETRKTRKRLGLRRNGRRTMTPQVIATLKSIVVNHRWQYLDELQDQLLRRTGVLVHPTTIFRALTRELLGAPRAKRSCLVLFLTLPKLSISLFPPPSSSIFRVRESLEKKSFPNPRSTPPSLWLLRYSLTMAVRRAISDMFDSTVTSLITSAEDATKNSLPFSVSLKTGGRTDIRTWKIAGALAFFATGRLPP
mmetsp:Transcript_16442/g.35969  ORF Transcript_16442/g.35969 Transcript_16442/m.35969 type:complete len:248 (+) Transcript_16442:971-1714(+)